MLTRMINVFLTAADTPRGEPSFHVRRNRGEYFVLSNILRGRISSLTAGEEVTVATYDFQNAQALAEVAFIDDVEDTGKRQMKRGCFPAINVVTGMTRFHF